MPNPTILQLLNNVSNFRYYSGVGNFNQNNLPFGPDRAGGAQSPEPYIKKPLQGNDPTGFVNAAVHTADDVLRISKFLVDVPKGPLFVAKQVGLQMMNPQMEHATNFVTDKNTSNPTRGQGFFNNVGNLATNTFNAAVNTINGIQNEIGTTRIWTPVNLLAQVGVSAAGGHIPRHGLSLRVDPKTTYPYIVKQNDLNGNNRLVNLLKNFSASKIGAEQKKELFSYKGGPNSYLGIGTTTINSYYSTFADKDNNGFTPIPESQILSIDRDGYVNIEPDKVFPDEYGNPVTIQGRRARIQDIGFQAYKKATNTAYASASVAAGVRITDYTKYNTTTRIGVINTNAKSGPENLNDSVNMVSLFYDSSTGGEHTDINGEKVNGTGNDLRDLIKFQIKSLDNDKPGYGVYMIFRAFLNGAISNPIDPSWNSTRYTGRGETFYAYEGTTETISFGFTIAALSKAEMKPLYQKLNYLKASLYPDYKGNKMRGNLIELTIGDYIKHQPGIISSMNIVIPEDANWEIAMDEPENGIDKDMHELPQIVKVEMSFIPIYNFLPRKSSQSPFIGIDDTEVVNDKTVSGKEWLKPKTNPVFNNK